MDRSTTKHSPRRDDQLEAETESLERGAPVEARREPSREKEGPGDDQPVPESDIAGDPVEWRGQSIDRRDVRVREEIGQAVAGAAFPATRDELVQQALGTSAADWVVDILRQLPGDEPLENVEAVWEALGGPEERRF